MSDARGPTMGAVLGFRVGNTWLGLEAACVDEITEQGEATPLPRAPRYVPGLINLRGDAVPLLDLAAFLELAGDAEAGQEGDFTFRRIVVVSSGDLRVGLLCDQVLGVHEVEIQGLDRVSVVQNHRILAFARGELELPVGLVALLAADKLLNASRVRK